MQILSILPQAERAEDMACNTACTVPVHMPGNGENGNGKGPSYELDIDLDCWQVPLDTLHCRCCPLGPV